MDTAQRKDWLKTCNAISKALGLKKGGKPPINLLKFCNQQRRESLKNPTAQIFSGKVTLYDGKGKTYRFEWPDDHTAAVEAAIEEGYWRVIENILYFSSPLFDMSARDLLTLQVVGEIFAKNKEIPPITLLDGTTKLTKATYKKYFAPLVGLAPVRLEMKCGALAPREKPKTAKEPKGATFKAL